MLISEIYVSRQGEGRLTGTPSVFVRTSGCNLRCDFCDTPFTSWNPTGGQLEVANIVRRVAAQAGEPLPERVDDHVEVGAPPARHVVVTGGEPMVAKGIVELCGALEKAGFHITIETAGTIDQMLSCDLMSISPKLSNSTPTVERAGQWAQRHEQTRYRPEVVAGLIGRHDYQLKFVVASEFDLEEIEKFVVDVESHGEAVDRSKVLLMPEGVENETLDERAGWLEPLCEERGFVFCPRMHIQWYGNKRGT